MITLVSYEIWVVVSKSVSLDLGTVIWKYPSSSEKLKETIELEESSSAITLTSLIELSFWSTTIPLNICCPNKLIVAPNDRA